MGRAVEHGAAVVGVVGASGTGKTTLLEALIAELRGRGLSLAVLKHASHGFVADRPGKDSHRLYEAGADAVALVSSDQVATFARRRDPTEGASLAAALASLPREVDLVLAEGFSWEPMPRIVVMRRGEPPPPPHLRNGEVLAIVETPLALSGGKPRFPRARIEALVGMLIERAQAPGEGRTLALFPPRPATHGLATGSSEGDRP